jgi:hypothetical protein
MQQLEDNKVPSIKPFSLSIWRPQPGFLVLDARNTQLALPTELLLHNILRHICGGSQFILDEEVLRWPMIENRFMARTADDARNELQTWLAVENELRPINKLWLMGENTARYWLVDGIDWNGSKWQLIQLEGSSLTANILPSLNELLRYPIEKAKLLTCLS